MRSIKALLVAGLAAAAMGAAGAYAQTHHGGGGHWSGGHGGHWSGGHGGHWGGGHWRGGHWGPSWGFWLGAPLVWSSWYWGAPYYYDYYYPPYYAAPVYPDRVIEVAPPEPTTDVGPRTEGAPTQGPLYMNYCESAKAYFPKVTKCPEGWRLATPSR